MLLNVYSTEAREVIQIDSSKLNPEIHVHRNTLEAFSKEDLASFGYKAK
jgi:hypothetical protein